MKSQYDCRSGILKCSSCRHAVAVPKRIQQSPLETLLFRERFEQTHEARGHLKPLPSTPPIRVFTRVFISVDLFDFGRQSETHKEPSSLRRQISSKSHAVSKQKRAG
jgi:hypothetical protein